MDYFFSTESIFALGLPPFVILLTAAVLVALTRGIQQKIILIASPIISALNFIALPETFSYHLQLFDLDLEIVYSDKLARLFGYLFHLAAFIAIIYALKVKDTIQHVASLAYAACAIGAVFAGDWITLFLFWEGLALTSVFLIWARRTERSYRSGVRYIIMQVLSGVLLLAGALILMANNIPAKVDALSLSGNINDAVTLGSWLIFIAFGIKAGFPLFHTWITDSYPEATYSGTVFLTCFTSKVGIYILARCFAGTELLIPIGLTMACFTIFLAIIENDLRRVLAYSMVNQIGFMLCGIGVGTELGINGTVATAFNHVIYKGLLMMSMGAVLYRVGHVNGSDLGGLYKSMPITTVCCLIGAASISVPLFSGFVSKSLIMLALLEANYTIGWLILLFAAASVFLFTGIKVPFFAFFAQDKGIKVKEAPKNMLIAMLISSSICLYIGMQPDKLYQLLPYQTSYHPYDLTHVLTQLQLLFFSALAFVYLYLKGHYPTEIRSINLDSDWLYRKAFPAIYRSICSSIISIRHACQKTILDLSKQQIVLLKKMSGPYGLLSRGWGANNMIFIVVLILAALLLFRF